MDEHSYYKNDRKLNGEWMRLYLTSKCKTYSIKNKWTKCRIREIFEPIDDLGWKIKEDCKSSEEKNLLQKGANLNEVHFGLLRKHVIFKN